MNPHKSQYAVIHWSRSLGEQKSLPSTEKRWVEDHSTIGVPPSTQDWSSILVSICFREFGPALLGVTHTAVRLQIGLINRLQRSFIWELREIVNVWEFAFLSVRDYLLSVCVETYEAPAMCGTTCYMCGGDCGVVCACLWGAHEWRGHHDIAHSHLIMWMIALLCKRIFVISVSVQYLNTGCWDPCLIFHKIKN